MTALRVAGQATTVGYDSSHSLMKDNYNVERLLFLTVTDCNGSDSAHQASGSTGRGAVL